MSLSRDQQRIVKMDVAIMELRYLYERELQHEIMVDKHQLLMSRGIKYRIDKLVSARAQLQSSMKSRMTKSNTYAVELAQRKEAVDNAQKQVDEIISKLASKLHELQQMEAVGVKPTEAQVYEYKYLIRDLPKARMTLVNKERALTNWLVDGQIHALRMSKDKLPKQYNPEEDAVAFYGPAPDDEIAQAALAHSSFDITQVPDYNKKPENSATLELLEQFENTKKEIEQPKALDSKDGLISKIEPTTQELELRELQKMHGTKYEIPVIE